MPPSSSTLVCPLCEAAVPRAELVPHMDACRDARCSALAVALGIRDERVVALFRPAIHDASKHAVRCAPDDAGSESLLSAANAAGGHPSFSGEVAAFSASEASPAEHAIVMLMKNWNLPHCRIFNAAQAKTTVTDEKISTKVLIRPGSTGNVRSGHGKSAPRRRKM